MSDYTAKLVSTQELKRVGNAIKKMVRFKMEQVNVDAYLKPSGFPNLKSFFGNRLRRMYIKGFLDAKENELPIFEDILSRGTEIGNIGMLSIQVGFEEQASKQSRSAYDSFLIRQTKGVYDFGYSSNGSRVCNEIEYARLFMKRLISTTCLPMRVSDKGAHYALESLGNAIINITRSRGFNKESPSGFTCVLPDTNPSKLIRMLSVCEKLFLARKFEQSWAVNAAEFEPEPSILERLYLLAAQFRFPAKSYELNIEFQLCGDLDRIEALAALCGPKDEILVSLGSCMLDDDNFLNFDLKLTSGGIWLQLESRFNVDPKKLSETLGIEVVKV